MQPDESMKYIDGFQTKTRTEEDDIVLVEDTPQSTLETSTLEQSVVQQAVSNQDSTVTQPTSPSSKELESVPDTASAPTSKIPAYAKSAVGSYHDIDDVTLLEYKPFAGTEKWIENRFSSANSTKAWFALGLLLLFFTVGGPAWIVHRLLKQFL